ncbi:MAG TPA: aspartate carbamoyltransferase [Deltaproteobacteria bacterium]|nr:MAG: aspartate carbamoyltransferase [Deltaproteobacteria bacterium GWC2_65_14]HBO70048.1 aspartate carbamoyltransferase [Deltaproteobacteria bacterium]
MEWRRRHVLGLADFSPEEIQFVVDTAKSMEEVLTRDIKKVPALRGKTVVNLFFEASTRTRTSFEIAGKRLSADVVNFSFSSSSAAKGESLLDTAKNIDAMKPNILVMRHPASGASHFLSRHVSCSVVNAGDGTNEHPSQGLLDLYTILKVKKKIKGLNIAIIGDILHSRVVRSDLHSLGRMGAKIRLCGPPTLVPKEMERTGARVTWDLREAVKDADVVMMLRIQLERQKSAYFPSLREYSRRFGLNREVFSLAKEDAVIMHPGPINRGVELSDDLADCAQSIVLNQVESGVAVRMALLYLLAGGQDAAH